MCTISRILINFVVNRRTSQNMNKDRSKVTLQLILMFLAVRCFDNGYVGKQPVAWKEYCVECWLKELRESMDRCTDHYDITEILVKNGVKHHTINRSDVSVNDYFDSRAVYCLISLSTFYKQQRSTSISRSTIPQSSKSHAVTRETRA